MSYFPEEELARSEEVCQREPLAARTRLALLRLEKEGHRAGWDSEANSPTIFRFERHPEKHYVHTTRSQPLTELLRFLCALNDGDVGEALQDLAGALEGTRAGLGTCGVPATADVMGGERAGHLFYGYALRNEGWATNRIALGDDEELDEGLMQAVRAKKLHEHPDRVESRMVHLVCRDGLYWWCIRLRRQPPAECLVMRPESNFSGAGLVLNALGRMTAAAAGNIVPVPEVAGADEVIRRVRRR